MKPMKQLILILSVMLCSRAQCQQVKYDTLISNQIYKSYYSKSLLNPVIVTYTLYKGGGNESREGMTFKNDIHTLHTQTTADYEHSGYDKGHMVNAEDFAYNSTLEEITFRYYNCVPQTPELNRGDWKRYETLIRKVSQTDTLHILCYNEFTGIKIDKLYVPSYCYKFVYNVKQKKVTLAFKYTNTKFPKFTNLLDSLPKYSYLTCLIDK